VVEDDVGGVNVIVDRGRWRTNRADENGQLVIVSEAQKNLKKILPFSKRTRLVGNRMCGRYAMA